MTGFLGMLFGFPKCPHVGMWLSLCSHICQSQNNVLQIQICSRAPIGLCLSACLTSLCSPVRAVAPLSLRILLVPPLFSLVLLYLSTYNSATLAKSSHTDCYVPYSQQRWAPLDFSQKIVSLFKPPVSGQL